MQIGIETRNAYAKFQTLTQSQLHEKDIERHRISWSVQTHASQTHRHTDRQPHPQTTPRVSVETYSTRGETVGYKKVNLQKVHSV